MRFRLSVHRPDRLVSFCFFSGFMLLAAGCQSGDGAGALGSAATGAKSAGEKVTEAELRAYCPKVTLRDGTSFFNVYAGGAKDDPAKLVYQTSISDVTRTCRSDGGAYTMNVAVAGRIVPGPSFTPGTVNMPIRVAVMHGTEVLYSQLHSYPVNVSDGGAASQFVFNDPNVSFTMPSDGVQVYAGFDESAPAKSARKAKKK